MYQKKVRTQYNEKQQHNFMESEILSHTHGVEWCIYILYNFESSGTCSSRKNGKNTEN